jgi:hypothetical protein
VSGLLINPYSFAAAEEAYTNAITNVGTVENVALGSGQQGWEFTVGAADLNVRGVRILLGETTTGVTARMYRVSTAALLAVSPETATTAGVWTEEILLDDPITLLAGVNYCITVYRGGASLGNTKRNTNFSATGSVTSDITVVGRRIAFSASTDMPTGTGSNEMWGIPDFFYSVAGGA